MSRAFDDRYPVVLDNGAAFVTGLTSTSGSTGADGPTYPVDLTPILSPVALDRGRDRAPGDDARLPTSTRP